jgi:large subunit ribosomal protein L9
MKLLLRRNIENVGKIGEIVDVSDGYGRNYLMPERLAVPVTPDNKRQIEVEKVEYAQQEAERKTTAERMGKTIESTEVEILAKSQDDGSLYGSISPKEIAERLRVTREMEIDWKSIKIHDPIKKVGDFEVDVKLHPEVIVTLKVKVSREVEEE